MSEDNQLSNIPEKILESFPRSAVVLMLISGAIFFLLSPLSFIVPKFLSNPFSNLAASDVLESFAVIAICAFILGAIFFTIRDSVLANNGFNSRVRHPFKKTLVESKKDIDPDFHWWIKNKNNDDISLYYDFLVFKNSAFEGLLLGFEISFLADLVYLAGIALFSWLPSLTSENIGKIIITFIFFLSVIWYNKKKWREESNRTNERLYQIFLSEKGIKIASTS